MGARDTPSPVCNAGSAKTSRSSAEPFGTCCCEMVVKGLGCYFLLGLKHLVNLI